MLKATVKFFDIEKCGYYLRGNSNPTFSDINKTLKDLNTWTNDGRDFVNTSTYEPDPDNDLRNTYFCAWHNNEVNLDSVLILWNEAPNDSNVIYGMNPMEKPGNTSMLTTGFGNKKAISGFPSYFWFIPEKNVFATIRFTHSLQGKGNLDNYLNGFLANKSQHKLLDADGKVIGYSDNGKVTKTSAKTQPKFSAKGRMQKELEAELLTNIHKIRKIVKRETLQYELQDDRQFLERMFSSILGNTPNFNQARSIYHELEFQPTKTELQKIISNYDKLNAEDSIRNIGFVYNDGKRIMLNGVSVSFPIDIDAKRQDNQIITPQELLTKITFQRQNLLRPLEEEQSPVEEEGAMAR